MILLIILYTFPYNAPIVFTWTGEALARAALAKLMKKHGIPSSSFIEQNESKEKEGGIELKYDHVLYLNFKHMMFIPPII